MSIIFVLLILFSGEHKVGYRVVLTAECQAEASNEATRLIGLPGAASIQVACVPEGNEA